MAETKERNPVLFSGLKYILVCLFIIRYLSIRVLVTDFVSIANPTFPAPSQASNSFYAYNTGVKE